MDSCDAIAPLLRRFVAGPLEAGDRAALRAHVEGCAACREEYEQAVHLAAGLGSVLRGEREAVTRARRHEALRPIQLARASAEAQQRRTRGLRPLLYPAAIAALLFATLRPGGLQAPDLVPLVGVVEAGTRTLEERGPLRQGERVATPVGGRARIEGRTARVELGEDTCLLVERWRRLRLRLVRGTLAIEGETTVALAGATVVVEKGARASVELAGAALTVAAAQGDVHVVTRTESRALAPGERWGTDLSSR